MRTQLFRALVNPRIEVEHSYKWDCVTMVMRLWSIARREGDHVIRGAPWPNRDRITTKVGTPGYQNSENGGTFSACPGPGTLHGGGYRNFKDSRSSNPVEFSCKHGMRCYYFQTTLNLWYVMSAQGRAIAVQKVPNLSAARYIET